MGRYQRATRLVGRRVGAGSHRGRDDARRSGLLGDPVGVARLAIGDQAVDRALAEGRAIDGDAASAYAHDDA